ncbi:MAG: CidA/LrgA family protein [Pseudomonadota bacterium]
MIAAFTLLLVCQLVGEVLVRGFGWPVPGPVVGMVILFVGLVVRGGVPPSLDRVAAPLLQHFALLFVPAGVGVIAHLALIESEWLPLALAVVPGTLVAVLVTGWTLQRVGAVAGDAADR